MFKAIILYFVVGVLFSQLLFQSCPTVINNQKRTPKDIATIVIAWPIALGTMYVYDNPVCFLKE